MHVPCRGPARIPVCGGGWLELYHVPDDSRHPATLAEYPRPRRPRIPRPRGKLPPGILELARKYLLRDRRFLVTSPVPGELFGRSARCRDKAGFRERTWTPKPLRLRIIQDKVAAAPFLQTWGLKDGIPSGFHRTAERHESYSSRRSGSTGSELLE